MSANRSKRVYTQPKGAINKWDRRQRLALHVIRESFQPSWATSVEVFNELFKDHLGACNLPNGVTLNILRAQYAQTERAKPCWAAIVAGPTNDNERTEKNDMIREIRRITAGLQPGSAPTVGGLATRHAPTTAENHAAVPRSKARAPSQPNQAKKRLSEFLHVAIDKRPRLEPSSELLSGTDNASKKFSHLRSSSRVEVVVASSSRVARADPATPTTGRTISYASNETPATSKPTKFTPVRASSVQDESLPRVVIPVRSEGTISPASRRSPLKASNLAKKTCELSRTNSSTLLVSPDAYEKALQPAVPVPEALAHPLTSGLLFRYWDEGSFGTNSETGFTAGRFAQTNMPPRAAPKCTELDWTDTESHFRGLPCASPFCSASNCLVWILRLALKQKNKGKTQGRITLIDASALPTKSVFYARPYMRQLRRKYVFTDGAWNYPATHEFLIWASVPRRALIHTFSTTELLAACTRMPAMAAALRMETIGTVSRQALKTTILSQLAEQQLPLSPQTTVVIARLCRFVGLTASSPLPHLEHVVSDVLQGWKFAIQPKSSAEWSTLASIWCHKLCGRDTLPSHDRQMALQMCFLEGVKAGLGEWNFMQDTKLINRMQRKAKAIGLESTTRIILDSLANATSSVLEYERQVDKRYAEAAATRLLPGIENFFRL